MSCLVRTRGMASKSLADFGALLVAVTILGNASLHRPQPLDPKVRVCVSVCVSTCIARCAAAIPRCVLESHRQLGHCYSCACYSLGRSCTIFLESCRKQFLAMDLEKP